MGVWGVSAFRPTRTTTDRPTRREQLQPGLLTITEIIPGLNVRDGRCVHLVRDPTHAVLAGCLGSCAASGSVREESAKPTATLPLRGDLSLLLQLCAPLHLCTSPGDC